MKVSLESSAARRQSLIGLNMISDLKNDRLIAAVREALSGGAGNFEGEYVSVTAGKTVMAKASFRYYYLRSGKCFRWSRHNRGHFPKKKIRDGSAGE